MCIKQLNVLIFPEDSMTLKKELLDNIKLIHTTKLGVERIRKNLKLDVDDVVEYCVDIIENEKSVVEKRGKNYYVSLDNTVLTVNSSSYTIITAHNN